MYYYRELVLLLLSLFKMAQHASERDREHTRFNELFILKRNVCRFLFGFIYSCVYDQAQSYYTSIVSAIQLVC